MSNVKRQMSAFTLGELLIVIAILTIVSVIGIGAYGRIQRTIALDLEADKLVERLHTLRDQAKTLSRCRGIAFENGKPAREIEAPHVNKARPCGDIARGREIALANKIVVAGTKTAAGNAQKLEFLFAPPHGTVMVTPQTEWISITLTFKHSLSTTRTVRMDTGSGVIRKI